MADVASLSRIRRVACLGAGYVGGPTMAMLAEKCGKYHAGDHRPACRGGTGEADGSNGSISQSGNEPLLLLAPRVPPMPVDGAIHASYATEISSTLFGANGDAVVSGKPPSAGSQCVLERVVVADIDPERIAAWQRCEPPIHEPGLRALLHRNLRTQSAHHLTNKNPDAAGGVLEFTTDIEDAVADADVVFIAVATPSTADGGFDLSAYQAAATAIALYARGPTIVVEKSTVPVRTAELLEQILKSKRRGAPLQHIDKDGRTGVFEVISNPEFLAEGTAVADLLNIDRVLIGHRHTESGRVAAQLLSAMYQCWVPADRILLTGVWSAELSKLASNAMLAQRLSSINALSMLCEATGADVCELAAAVGMDQRIGSRYLQSGVGFGGSCLGKDLRGLIYLCRSYQLHDLAIYWQGVLDVNEMQQTRFADRVATELGENLQECLVGVLGVAFKPGTGDVRESSAIGICGRLLHCYGINLRIYDPQVASDDIYKMIAEYGGCDPRASLQANSTEKNRRILVCANFAEAVRGVDAVVLLTEWPEFLTEDLDWTTVKAASRCQGKTMLPVYDGRNCLSRDRLAEHGCDVRAVGRPAMQPRLKQ